MRGPMGDFVRRALSWGIVSSLLLPILALVVIGLGALLAALGDNVGARFCGRGRLYSSWFCPVVIFKDVPDRHNNCHLVNGSRGDLRWGSFLWGLSRVGVSNIHCSHVTVFPRLHAVYYAHPVSGVVIFRLSQQYHVTDCHVPLLLRPFVRQHPTPEDLAHPLGPELLLCLLNELEPLRQLWHFIEPHLRYLYRRTAQQQMQRRDWPARLRVTCIAGDRPAVDHLSCLGHYRVQLSHRASFANQCAL